MSPSPSEPNFCRFHFFFFLEDWQNRKLENSLIPALSGRKVCYLGLYCSYASYVRRFNRICLLLETMDSIDKSG